MNKTKGESYICGSTRFYHYCAHLFFYDRKIDEEQRQKAQAVFNSTDYGAAGDGKTNDAAAIQKAIDARSANHGGRVVIPSCRNFLAGPFTLKSLVELYIETGGKLTTNPDEKVYTKSAFRANMGEGTICGGGVIDGSGTSFIRKELDNSYELKPVTMVDPRPHLLTIIGRKFLELTETK